MQSKQNTQKSKQLYYLTFIYQHLVLLKTNVKCVLTINMLSTQEFISSLITSFQSYFVPKDKFVLTFFESYLTNMKQCVKISHITKNTKMTSKADFQKVAFGIPQGSITGIGLSLFLCYINDMLDIFRELPTITH